MFTKTTQYRFFRRQARQDEELSLEEQLRKKLTITGYVFRDRKARKPEFPRKCLIISAKSLYFFHIEKQFVGWSD